MTFMLPLMWQLELNLMTPTCFLKVIMHTYMWIYFGSLDTTLFAQNNTSATPNQKSLEQPLWLPAGAPTSELLFQMNNLGITDATPLQPPSYQLKKFPQPHLSVDDRENSHQDSHVCPLPTSSQSSFMFGSIAHPKQTTDVSIQSTEESVCTNLTDLTDKQLEQEDVGASASNHEVKDEYSICIKAILWVGKKKH